MPDAADLQGPLDELLARTAQLRAIMSVVEASSKKPELLTMSKRRDFDRSILGGSTTNTTNSMCIIFLASSFEEFFREIVSQCGLQLASSYANVSDEIKMVAKSSYWKASLDRLKFSSRILTRGAPRTLDFDKISKARTIIDSARSFVMMDDGEAIDGKTFCFHSRNFKPDVVDEISNRIGVSKVLRKASESHRIKMHFGLNTISEVEPKLVAKLNDFYQTRNDIVHSLNGSTGFGIDYVNDHIDLIETFSESLKSVFQKHVNGWAPVAA